MGPARSASVTGRRYAARASRATIDAAQARASLGPGWQSNTFRRLAVSESPELRRGPVIISSLRWGSAVIP